EIGKNWDGASGIALVGAKISAMGSLSGTTDVPYTLYAEHTTDMHIEQLMGAMNAGTAVGRFYLAGSAHNGVVIEPHMRYYNDGIKYILTGNENHYVPAHPRARFTWGTLPEPIYSAT